MKTKYEEKSWTNSDQKIAFDSAKFKLNINKDDLYSYAEYSCYQFKTICDFSSLINLYGGIKFNNKSNLTIGLQPMPFGPSRFWESNNYGGIVTQVGLEDIHNIGIKYHNIYKNNTDIELGYFIEDGGNYIGESIDSARYSSNLVDANDSSMRLEETNMFVVRLKRNIFLDNSIGISYWKGDVKNKNNNKNGSREAISIFGNANIKNTKVNIVLGRNNIRNKDDLNSDKSIFGSFDDDYYVANKGMFYTFDISYPIEDLISGSTITPYMMFSGYNKDKEGYETSKRDIYGVSLDKNSWSFTTEYIIGDNDVFIGGNKLSLAEGADKNESMFKITAAYNF